MTERSNPVAGPSDREIVINRDFDAPPELIWEAWTDPSRVAQWWGPNGFTNTIHEMEVRPGGVWRFIMHGPDGTDYPNKVLFTEVEKPRLLRYEHGDDAEDAPPPFHVTVTFEELLAGKTRLTLRILFDTVEQRDETVKFGAIEGGRQTLARLAEYLRTMRAEADSRPRLESPRFEDGRPRLVAGPKAYYRFTDAAEGIPVQWERFAPQIGRVPGQIGDATYGVSVSCDKQGFEYLCGVEVSDASGLPAEYSHATLPALRYAVFPHRGHVSLIPQTMNAIWREWLPASEHEATEAPCFERYGEEFDPAKGMGGVEIWLPLKEKTMKITVETVVKSDIDSTWAAWNNPDDINRWNAASEDWHTPRSSVDLRVGGKFNWRMEARDGSAGFDFEGTYSNIVEKRLIEYTMEDGRAVSVKFEEVDGGVKVTETFDAEGVHDAEMQRQGWQSILNNFARHVESKA